MVRFRSTEPAERDQVVAFLRDIFKLPPDDPLLSGPMVEWKFYLKHPLWNHASRSYVLEGESAYVAHGCVNPCLFWQEGECVRSFQMSDWASSGAVPGAGALLYRSLLPYTDTLLAIGGSDDAVRILPHFRIFQKVGSAQLYGLPLRPLRQILHSQKNIKTPLRFARNFIQSHRPRPSRGNWTAERVEAPGADWKFDEWIRPVVAAGMVPLRRSAEWLMHLLQCPAAPVSLFEIRENAALRGYAAVALALGQARIVDLLIGSGAQVDWSRALAALTGTVAKMKAADEIFTRTSLPVFGNALTDVGFLLRGEEDIYLADPGKKLRGRNLEINCLVGDSMYLQNPETPYIT